MSHLEFVAVGVHGRDVVFLKNSSAAMMPPRRL